jgi:hypothetical protein
VFYDRPFYGAWLPFEEWCQRGGQARAIFWATQGWANLERATFARYTLRQRHWPEEPYLHECLADLSATLPVKRRRKRRK